VLLVEPIREVIEDAKHDLAVRSPSQLALRSKIDVLQDALTEEIGAGRMEQTIVDAKEDPDQAEHYHGENLYVRSLLIPEGTALIGYIHKQDRVCIIAQGKCTFTDEFYGKKTVEAPWIGEFKAGTKTAVFAHVDTVWIACLGTELEGVNVMIDQLVVGTHDEYHKFINGEDE
jgi:hypothetical protein